MYLGIQSLLGLDSSSEAHPWILWTFTLLTVGVGPHQAFPSHNEISTVVIVCVLLK